MQLITNSDAGSTAWSKQDTWLHAVHDKPYQLEMLPMGLDWKTKTPEDNVSVTDEEQRPLHVVQQFLSTLEMQNNEPL